MKGRVRQYEASAQAQALLAHVYYNRIFDDQGKLTVR